MTAPAEDPRGGMRPCCGHPNALTDPLHAIPTAGRGDTDSGGEHVGSCRIFYAERRCTCVGSAAGRGDTDSGGEAIEPGLSVEADARRLKWFTDAELAAELNRRRALDGA